MCLNHGRSSYGYGHGLLQEHRLKTRKKVRVMIRSLCMWQGLSCDCKGGGQTLTLFQSHDDFPHSPTQIPIGMMMLIDLSPLSC